MSKRIFSLALTLCLLFTAVCGRIGYIIFSNNYAASTSYNHYSLNIGKKAPTVYYRNGDKATDNNETVIVTRKDEKNVVLMSLEQYNELMKALRNTQYLSKIDKSIEQIEKGKVVTKTIEELEAMESE